MTAFTLFLALDFGLAVAVAFYSGYLFGKDRGHGLGFRAGTAWASRVAAHFADEHAEPTLASSRR